MSDINLTFTWWEIVLFTLAIWFWPLTLAAAAAGFWIWRKPASRVARIIAIILALAWIGSAGTRLGAYVTSVKNQRDYEVALRARQTTLTRSEVVAGMHLPAGTVVTHGADFNSGEVTDLDLPAPLAIAGIPLSGHVHFSSGALDGAATLAHDAPIKGIPCSARSPLRFESGRLVECDLAEPSRVKGVPCVGHIDMQVGIRCELSGDYSRFGVTWRAKTNVTDFGDLVWFRIGMLPPTLRVFGAPLRDGSEVQFAYNRIASVDLQSNPAHFRGCAIDLVTVEHGAPFGRSTGQCSLPQAPGSLFIALPATTLRTH